MKAAILPVSVELIASALGLPSTDEIVHAEFRYDTRIIKLYLRGDENSDLPEIKEGEEYTTVTAELQKDENGKTIFISYRKI